MIQFSLLVRYLTFLLGEWDLKNIEAEIQMKALPRSFKIDSNSFLVGRPCESSGLQQHHGFVQSHVSKFDHVGCRLWVQTRSKSPLKGTLLMPVSFFKLKLHSHSVNDSNFLFEDAIVLVTWPWSSSFPDQNLLAMTPLFLSLHSC